MTVDGDAGMAYSCAVAITTQVFISFRSLCSPSFNLKLLTGE